MDQSSRQAGPQASAVATTADLLHRARLGDADALNDLFARYLPSLRRWARGRLPRWTRDLRDTDAVVQETLVQTLKHIGDFQPRHEGALQAYLRQALVNRVRDEVRRVNRHGVAAEIQDEHAAAVAASLMPAARASRVDVIQALRSE